MRGNYEQYNISCIFIQIICHLTVAGTHRIVLSEDPTHEYFFIRRFLLTSDPIDIL